ncbi:MAG: hypothetical protein IKA69_04680 [Kiritimatiellae bacterium]|nr:hypothetical protein [Kiritimatiellia bacterium]
MGDKTYQQWCIDTLVRILSERENYRITHGDQGYKYVLKAIISHYASMYYVDGGAAPKRKNGLCRSHLNIWWDHLNDKNKHYFFNSLIASKSAYDIYQDFVNANFATDSFSRRKGSLKHQLHIEHITPTGYIYDKFENLSEITESEVNRLFEQNKVILITKDESACLDGKGSIFQDEDLQLIKTHFPGVWPQYMQEANQVNGKSPKSQGFGLLRMARLYNSGVHFVYGCNGADVDMSEWMNYLTDHANIIKAVPDDNI